MIRHQIISLVPLLFVAGGPVDQTDDNLKQEYIRFAEPFSMVIGDDYSGLQDFRRQALARAQTLRSVTFTNPKLRDAAAEFGPLAKAYDYCQKLRAGSSWTMEEQLEAFGKLRRGDEEKGIANALQKTKSKAADFNASRELTIEVSAAHSRVWQDVIPIARRLGGPDKGTLPLRFLTTSALNTYGKALNNLTVIIETSISSTLPGSGRTHVIFVKRLDADEFLWLPAWLLDKQWNETSQQYEPSTNCLRCTILSDEVTCEDVGFDLKPAKIHSPWLWQKNVLLFPNDSFRGQGKYDPNTPIRPTAPDMFVVGSEWIGPTRQKTPVGETLELKLVVTERNAQRFKAKTTYRR
jgi:hypothetical protein